MEPSILGKQLLVPKQDYLDWIVSIYMPPIQLNLHVHQICIVVIQPAIPSHLPNSPMLALSKSQVDYTNGFPIAILATNVILWLFCLHKGPIYLIILILTTIIILALTVKVHFFEVEEPLDIYYLQYTETDLDLRYMYRAGDSNSNMFSKFVWA